MAYNNLDDINSLSKFELIKLARQSGLSVSNSMYKQEIYDLLNSAYTYTANYINNNYYNNINSFTKSQLIQLAKQPGLSVSTKMLKQEIYDLLKY